MAVHPRKPNSSAIGRGSQREISQETSPLASRTLRTLVDHGYSVHRVYYCEPRQQNAVNRDGWVCRPGIRPRKSPSAEPSEADGVGLGSHIRPGEDQCELRLGEDCVGHLHNNAFLRFAAVRDHPYFPGRTEPFTTICPRSILLQILPSFFLLDVHLHPRNDIIRMRDAMETAPSCICDRDERPLPLLSV